MADATAQKVGSSCEATSDESCETLEGVAFSCSDVLENNGDAIECRVEKGVLRSEWYHTSLLLVADVVGTGVLSLPGHFASLGWTLGIVLLLACALINSYTGCLLSRCKVLYPQSHTLSELADAVIGRRAAAMVYVLVYAYIFCVCGSYLLVLSKSLQSLFPSLCRPQAGLIACVCLLIPNSFRTLTSIAPISIISNLAIIVAVAICLVEVIFVDTASEDLPLPDQVLPPLTFWSAFSALSGAIFAFSGQKVYVEIMSEMRDVCHFPYALGAAMALISMFYAITCAIVYAARGINTPRYLLDVSDIEHRRPVSGLMFIHVTISYVINQQVFSRNLHARLSPQRSDALTIYDAEYRRSQLEWFAITTCVMCTAWATSNLLPFFADFVDIMGALASAPLSFLWPAIIFSVARQKQGSAGLEGVDRVIVPACYVVSIVVSCLGTISSVGNLIQRFHSIGPPFSCFPVKLKQ